jgi:acyl carrier protein
MDSLDTVEAIVALEDLLEVDLGDESALKIQTIPQALDALHDAVAKKSN